MEKQNEEQHNEDKDNNSLDDDIQEDILLEEDMEDDFGEFLTTHNNDGDIEDEVCEVLDPETIPTTNAAETAFIVEDTNNLKLVV